MKRFNITVNGKAYDVAVDEIAAGAPVAAAPAPVNAPAPVAAAPVAAPAAAPAVGGTEVKAPMPGTIMSVKVAVGDEVKRGQPLIVLEAMKMENDIVAPKDGTVAAIAVKKGDNVNSNSLLVTIQ